MAGEDARNMRSRACRVCLCMGSGQWAADLRCLLYSEEVQGARAVPQKPELILIKWNLEGHQKWSLQGEWQEGRMSIALGEEAEEDHGYLELHWLVEAEIPEPEVVAAGRVYLDHMEAE